MPDELSQIAQLFLSGPDSAPCPLTLRGLLAQHLPDPQAATKSLALHLARRLGSVGLLRLRADQALLQIFGNSSVRLPTSSSRLAQGDTATLCRLLADLPQHTSLLLLDLDVSAELLAQCPQVSVLVSPQPTVVVAAYSLLKQLAGNFAPALGITMIDCSTLAQGETIAQRLNQAAREFLSLPLRLDDIVLDNSRLRQKKLAQVPSPDQPLLGRTLRSVWGR